MNKHTATEIAYKNGYEEGRADTVRKMQELLNNRICDRFSYYGWYLKGTILSEIVREMLEGANENTEKT